MSLRPPQAADAVSCGKGWETSDWLTPTLPGGRCSSASFSSRYDCPARCVVSPDRLRQPQCAAAAAQQQQQQQALPKGAASGQQQPHANGSAAAATARCAAHWPCNPRRAGNASAPDGPCLCCDLRLDLAAVAANPPVGARQLWVLFVGQLVFLAWTLALTHLQLRVAGAADARVVTAADYSVLITRLPRGRSDDASLAAWCRPWGRAVACFNIPGFGDTLAVGGAVAALRVRQAEVEAWRAPGLLGWLFLRCAAGAPAGLRRALARAELKLGIYQRHQPEPTGAMVACMLVLSSVLNLAKRKNLTKTTSCRCCHRPGAGLVTFQYSHEAQACIAANARGPLDALLCGCTAAPASRLHGAAVRVHRCAARSYE